MPYEKKTIFRRPGQHQSKSPEFNPFNHLDAGRNNLGPVVVMQNRTRRIQQLFSAVDHEVADLRQQATANKEHAVAEAAWEKNFLLQEIERLRKCCQDMQWEKIRAQEQLALERRKCYPRFLNAIRDRRDTQCEACHRRFPEVHLTQCFHLLCRECYTVQGPNTPKCVGDWACKACSSACVPESVYIPIVSRQGRYLSQTRSRLTEV